MRLEKLIHTGQWEAYCRKKEVKSLMAEMRRLDRFGRAVGYSNEMGRLSTKDILGDKNELT